MAHNKKYFGNAVDAIFKTITEIYCCVGDEDLEDIVNMFNMAHVMAAMWNLKEINSIKEKMISFNKILADDDSDFRIIKDRNTYKLVRYR